MATTSSRAREQLWRLLLDEHRRERLSSNKGTQKDDDDDDGLQQQRRLVLDVLRALKEIEEDEKRLTGEMGRFDVGAADLTQLFKNGQEVIINIFSTSIYNTLILYADGFIMLVVVVLVFLLWVMTNAPVRSWLIPKLTNYTLGGQESQSEWRDVLLKMNNFFTMLLMFIVFQFIANQLTSAWIGSMPDAGESIVGAIIIAMIVFAVLNLIKSF